MRFFFVCVANTLPCNFVHLYIACFIRCNLFDLTVSKPKPSFYSLQIFFFVDLVAFGQTFCVNAKEIKHVM